MLQSASSAYVEASQRASSVISKAKTETWQATCNNLFSRSNPCAIFNLLNTVAGKKGSSHDLEFPNSQFPKDTANIYASYLCLHLSQQTFRLPRGAERSFMNDLYLDQCSYSSLHNIFCSPFTTKKLTTAISKLSTSTASGPDLIAYPLLTHFPPFSPATSSHHLHSSTGPGLLTPFPHAENLPPLSPFTNSVNLPTLQPPFIQFLSPPVSSNSLST